MKCLICIIPYFDLAVDQTAFDYLSHSLLRESLTSTKQAELHALYAEAAQNIYKETQGEAFGVKRTLLTFNITDKVAEKNSRLAIAN